MAQTPETTSGLNKSPESGGDRVVQPVKIESHLHGQLGTLLEEVNRISENAGEGPGEQWSDTTSGSVATGSQAKPVVSTRQQAIASIPAPAVMQKELEKHIRTEVKTLRKQAQQISRMSRPGAAYRLNQIYTRIRHLNSLLAEILHASGDVLKRLFIKVFIDRQAIL